jgi:hypothetical protein
VNIDERRVSFPAKCSSMVQAGGNSQMSMKICQLLQKPNGELSEVCTLGFSGVPSLPQAVIAAAERATQQLPSMRKRTRSRRAKVLAGPRRIRLSFPGVETDKLRAEMVGPAGGKSKRGAIGLTAEKRKSREVITGGAGHHGTAHREVLLDCGTWS